MNYPREGTEFCSQYYYLAIALSRIEKEATEDIPEQKKKAQNLIYVFD